MACGGLGRDRRLTDKHIASLAPAFSNKSLESVAQRFLGIHSETIVNLHTAHRENVEAINRAILEKWRNKNPGPNQVQVIPHTQQRRVL